MSDRPMTSALDKVHAWLRKKDFVVLLLSLVLVIGAWAFFELADEVREGSTQRLDETVLLFLRDSANPADALGPPWLEDMVRDLTALGGVAVITLITAGVLGFLLLQRQFQAFNFVIVAVGGGLLLNLALKNSFSRARPEIVPHLSHVATSSFPSGHSMLSALVYLTLAALLARLVHRMDVKLYIVGVALLFSFLVGFSRVYLGVHYPTDVLAGWTLGLVWAVLCWLAARFLQKRGKI